MGEHWRHDLWSENLWSGLITLSNSSLHQCYYEMIWLIWKYSPYLFKVALSWWLIVIDASECLITHKADALRSEFFDISKFSSKQVDIVYRRHDVLQKLIIKININPTGFDKNCHHQGNNRNVKKTYIEPWVYCKRYFCMCQLIPGPRQVYLELTWLESCIVIDLLKETLQLVWLHYTKIALL